MGKDEILCKKCPTCKIVKTPRVYHCSVCDCCIAVHDHHCPWIGACIGQRNHIYFFLYSWVTKILALFVLVLNIHMVSNNKDTIMMVGGDNFSKLTIPQALMAVYGLMVAVLLMCLTTYHTAAIGSNETTQEDIREKYETWGGNPYNMGKWSS